MQIEVITNREQWNTFVESEPNGNVTQTYEWGELQGSLSGDAIRLGALQDGVLQGTMSIVVGEAPLLRRPYLYVPRGPVIADPASPVLHALCTAAADEAQRRGAFMLKLEPNIPDGDTHWLAALRKLGFCRNRFATHPRRSWVLDIRPSEEDLLSAMKEKWRYNIGLAGRKKVKIREAMQPEDIAVFYRLYEETAKRDGFFIHPQEHYATILRLYGERNAAVLLLAEYENTPIAGLVAVRCGSVTTYMFGASSNTERNRMPNHLLQWTAIRWAKSHGCTLYDFRAIAEVLDPREDLYSLFTFKQGFGGYSTLTLETHDFPYSAPIYWMYQRTLAVKRARDRRLHERELHQRQTQQSAAKPLLPGQVGKAPKTSTATEAVSAQPASRTED